MRGGTFYSFCFTVLLSSVCAALLAFAHTQWAPRIQANERYARTRAIVDALGLLGEEATRKQVIGLFDRQVQLKRRGEMDVYEGREDGDRLVGYAVDLVAQGKYGPIRGILAIAPDEQSIKSLRIYQQNETPGLGGRIGDPVWLAGFRGKPLVTDGVPGIIISNTVKGPHVVDAITGASQIGRAHV